MTSVLVLKVIAPEQALLELHVGRWDRSSYRDRLLYPSHSTLKLNNITPASYGSFAQKICVSKQIVIIRCHQLCNTLQNLLTIILEQGTT